MFTKTLEPFDDGTSAAFDYLGDNGPCIIEPDFRGNAADVFKHCLKSFHQALEVFTIIKLEITAVAEGKAQDKVLGFMMKLSVFIEISVSEVGLSPTRTMVKRNASFFPVKLKLLFLLADIHDYKPVTAVEIFVFFLQTSEYALCGVSLLTRGKPVCHKP